ncbi:hypothetical protein B7P43_G01885 [Cryptotermes secundus]|uniref:Uncharacterized protein n=1 Tax=Cryptotermes secundus TaxID=105785 RepID=A0A2J7R460_9NEOP|nr:hypothetical protein B7P43_G01885 [Cryptotermes secundus]
MMTRKRERESADRGTYPRKCVCVVKTVQEVESMGSYLVAGRNNLQVVVLVFLRYVVLRLGYEKDN